MISAWNLIWIIPVSLLAGAFVMALAAGTGKHERASFADDISLMEIWEYKEAKNEGRVIILPKQENRSSEPSET